MTGNGNKDQTKLQTGGKFADAVQFKWRTFYSV